MIIIRKTVEVIAAITILAGSVLAIPLLQLDVSSGIYDSESQIVIAQGSEFTLYAIGNSKIDLTDTYTLSIALMPLIDENTVFDVGSFVFNEDEISVTNSSMEFGTPTNNAGNELPEHGIFPTFYLKHSFQFTGSKRAASYNVENIAGGFIADPDGDLFYEQFTFNISDLDNDYGLHFDLYNTTDWKGNGAMIKAPFSHDAQTGPTRVPEPATISFIALSIVAAIVYRTKK